MQPKTYLLIFSLIAVTISCGQKTSSTETTAQASQAPIDSTVAEPVAAVTPVEQTPVEEEPDPVEPPIDAAALVDPMFGFLPGAITDDKDEASTLKALEELSDRFNGLHFVTITSSYTGGDPVTGGIVKEENTWYYNADRELCASSRTYKSDRTTEEAYYLCEKNNLIAMVLDSDFYDEGAGYTTNIRIANSHGVIISNDDGDGYEVKSASLYEHETGFFSSHNDMREALNEVTELTKQGDRYLAVVLGESNIGVDTMKYSVDAHLVKKFFRKASVEQ